MSEAEESKVLRYGQIVALHFFDDENGFVSADGHVKKHVSMRGYEKYYSAQYAIKHETKMINKDDFSNCLFQIYPKVVNTQKTKIHREIEAYKRQKMREDDQNELTTEKLNMFKFTGEKEKRKTQQDNTPAGNSGARQSQSGQASAVGGAAPGAAAAAEDGEEDRDVLMKRISKYQVTLQNEFKYNVDTFENNKNTPLSYTQPFQLLHLNSSKFLACNFLESKHEKENYEIALEEFCSDSTLFNIVPAFKYQKDSSLTISEGDCVWIVRALPFNNKTIHLHCSMELSEMKRKTLMQKQVVNATFQNASSVMRMENRSMLGGAKSIERSSSRSNNNNNQSSSNNGNGNNSNNGKKVIDKREINGCLEQATTLKFKIYQNVTQEKSKYLNCGDAIWLHHSEANSALSVIRKERGTTRYTFTSIHIESWISKDNLDLFVGQTKENTSFEDYSGNTFGLWVIENVDFKKGGQVEYGAGYRLKHMSTGYYLTVVDENAMLMKQKFDDLKKVQEEFEKKKTMKNTKQLGPTRYESNTSDKDSDEEDEEDQKGIIEYDGMESPRKSARGGMKAIPENEDGEVSVASGDDEDEMARQEQKKKQQQMQQKKKKKSKQQGLAEKEKELEILRGKIAKKWKLALTTNAKDEFTLFQFFALGTSQSIYEQYVEQGNFVFIRNLHSNQWVDVLNLLHPSTAAAAMSSDASGGSGGGVAGGAAAAAPGTSGGAGGGGAVAAAAGGGGSAAVKTDIPAQAKHAESKKQLSEFNQDESTAMFSPLRITLKNDQAENQVFKVFQISSNEVWEAKFVISCSNVLLKFLLNQKAMNEMCNQGDEISIRSAKQKIKTSRLCIQNINNFCCNKLLNYQPEQKLGVPNPRRQKLLREQYYIDFLVKILEDLLPKEEMELWIEYKRIMDKEKLEKERENMMLGGMESSDSDDDEEEEAGANLALPSLDQRQSAKMSQMKKEQKKKKKKAALKAGQKISKLSAKKDHALYLKEKVDMAKDIYVLLTTLCKNNTANEEYAFKLIPFFQIQCKYLPEAIDCLIQLVSNNERILTALSENLKIEFDYEKKEELEPAIAAKPVKIIINLYDESSSETAYGEGKIAFRQHEKITSKPINLIVFFMNLIWDENSLQKSNYLKFLRSISRFQNKGISLNQENIFKIYKNYTKTRNVIRYDQYFKSGSIKLPEILQDKKIFEYDVSEQLKFYAELSFGRNFLWRKELIPHFSNYYLLQNIWSQGDLKEYPILRSCFCQLAMSLYIDHEPLQRAQIPNFCRLYNSIGEYEDIKVFDEEKNQENEIVMYKALIGGLEKFLKSVSESIAALVSIAKDKDKQMGYKEAKQKENILHDPLLLHSLELLSLLVELNLYGSLESTQSYKNLTPYLFNILVYDLKNLENFASCASTLQEQNNARKEEKTSKKNPRYMLNFSDINSKLKNVAQNVTKTVAGGSGGDDKEDEVDYELDSQELANPLEQSKLYDNHIMRGQIKLHNQLEEMNFQDSSGYLSEIKVKITVLDILEKFMDLRQNYLMTNMLKFFKDFIGNKSFPTNVIEAKKQITEILRANLKGFLPNIPLTGNDAVDKIFQPKEQSNLLKDLTTFKMIRRSKSNTPPVQEKFKSYIQSNIVIFSCAEMNVSLILFEILDQKFVHYQDINNLLSAAFEGNDTFEDPVTTCLPQLLSSFLIIYDETLEKRLLKIMIRMYNQRTDLLDNIQKIQVIFDNQTNQLFRCLEENLMRLNKYVEQCEVWFTTFAKNSYENHQISYLIELLENINNGFFKSIAKADGKIQLLETSKPRHLQQVNKEKQKIYQYLKVYEPILSLLKEGMHHFNEFILDQTYPVDKKPHLIKLFELVYEFLYFFTTNDKENQAIIQKYYPLIAEYLKYDLGQMRVICSIYKDNSDLLNNYVDKKFMDVFLDLIETEGKQIHFLDIFSTILKCNNKYIFDNQLLVLNTFLPQKSIGEKEYNLLYAIGSSAKQFRFYLEDVCKSLEQEKLNAKLLEVDYRDTYRDEPFIYHIKILNLLIETCQISQDVDREEVSKQLLDATTEQVTDNHMTKSQKQQQQYDVHEKDIVLKDDGDDNDNSGDEDNEDDNDDALENNNANEDDGDDNDNPNQMTKQQLLEQRREARMQKLIQRSKLDPAFAKVKFNISIARLKRNFRVFDLLQMLNMDDSFASWQKFSNQINKKPDLAPKIKDTEGKQGIFEEALNDKEEIERKKQIEEQKKKFLSANQYQDEVYKEQQRIFKQGMCILKPHLLNFMRKVHISSETVISAASDMIVQQKEIASFFDKEAIKISCIMPGFFQEDYVKFIFDQLVPFVYDYYKKFVEGGPHNEHIQEDEERHDDKSLFILLEKIIIKLPLFTPYLTPVTYIMGGITRLIIDHYCFIELDPKTALCFPSQAGQRGSPEKKAGVSAMKKTLFNFKRGNTQELNIGQAQPDAGSEYGEDDDKVNLLSSNKKQQTKGALNVMKIMTKMTTTTQKQITETAERNWRLFKEILKEDNRVREQVSNEKIVLAEAIVRVKSIIKPELAKDLVVKPDMFKLIKKFIKFLQYAPEDPSNKETIISLLAVLKEVIESQGIDEQDGDDIDEEKAAEKRVKIQNMFDQLGAMKMVMTVLSQGNSHLDNELIINYLSFANSLLEGGNNSVQTTIFTFFMSYQKSEVIFHRFNTIIRRQIRSIEHRKEGQDSNFSNDSEEENKEMIELLEMVLRFLQLCVEGHYIDLQNYLRKQENSRNNYDMVQAVADLLKAYYYGDRTQKMYDNMIFCLDTLSEFVQGPCKDNQEAVSDSKFFDIASDLFSKQIKTDEERLKRKAQKRSWKEEVKGFENQEEKYRRTKDQPLTRWMIARLQNKVLILVLSLLESREVKYNCDIIKRIMRNLPLYVLQRHLIKIFKQFQTYYGLNFNRSSLSHTENDPRKESDQNFFKQLSKDGFHIDQYLECVLQNGFQIYFLLSYYIESDGKLGGEMVKIFKNYEKKILNDEKGDLEDLLTGDNILGQMISFARSLIESVLNYVDKVKDKAVNVVMSFQSGQRDSKMDQARQAARSKALRNGMNFFAKNSAHIDIVRNDELELVYFIKLPPTNCLPKDIKTAFHEVCDRSNIKTKQAALVKEAPDLIQICKHEYQLKILFSSNKILAIFANFVKLWKDLSFYISLVLNIFIIASFSTPQGGDWYLRMTDYNLFNDPNYTQAQTESLFRALGIAMIVCSNFVLMFFLFKNVPLIIQKAMNQGIQMKDYKSFFGRAYVGVIKSISIIFIFLQDVEVVYYIAYGALAVIGTVVHPFFFTFHLTAILMRYPTLKNVVMSIYLPRKQLLLTFLLFIVLEYCFSVWGYSQFPDEYAGTCESLLYCFLTTFDQTFKPNGGLGGYFAGNELQTNVTPNTAQYNLWRFFFDQIFQYVMLNIMINIVVGIIIDTFGLLREESNERSQDMDNFCFICGIEKTTFDRKSDSGKGFQKHIKFNHYMWNYVYYILYLEWKERSEYTGIESYVDDLLQQNDTYWMPFKQAREIADVEDEDEEGNFSQLTHIEKKQSGLIQEVNHLVESIQDIAKEKKERRDKKK